MIKLTILIPTLNEADNLRFLLPRIHEILIGKIPEDEYEILIVDAKSKDGTEKVAEENRARLIEVGRGYGIAIAEGIRQSRGQYIVTMDADFSHSPYIIPILYSYREQAELLIASRYIKNGFNHAPFFRNILSLILNSVFRFALSIPVRDMSSGFRLYNKKIFDVVQPKKQNYVVLQEILMKSYAHGFTVKEVPFHYHPRKYGSSKARLLKFGVEYLCSLYEFWKFRNSMNSADYEERAFHSRIFFQKYWQQKRYLLIVEHCKDLKKVLDVGCGSSQILEGLPQSVGCDIQFNRLRYKRCPFRTLLQASIYNLPFKDESFEAVILSQLIEHLPENPQIFKEAVRVVKKGGFIIIGTPDYSTRWAIIEKIYKFIHPRGFEDRHLTKYTKKSLTAEMEKNGCKYFSHEYIMGAELIIKFQKL